MYEITMQQKHDEKKDGRMRKTRMMKERRKKKQAHCTQYQV